MIALTLFILACAVLAFCGIVGVLELVWSQGWDRPPDVCWDRRQRALARASQGPRGLP